MTANISMQAVCDAFAPLHVRASAFAPSSDTMCCDDVGEAGFQAVQEAPEQSLHDLVFMTMVKSNPGQGHLAPSFAGALLSWRVACACLTSALIGKVSLCLSTS